MNLIPEWIKEQSWSYDLRKYSAAVLSIWILGLSVTAAGFMLSSGFDSRMDEADTVIAAARRVNSAYEPQYGGRGAISEISETAEALGVKDRMSGLKASQSGAAFEVSGLDTETLSKLIRSFSKKGLRIKSCEIKTVQSGKTPVSLKASFVIGADKNENTGGI